MLERALHLLDHRRYLRLQVSLQGTHPLKQVLKYQAYILLDKVCQPNLFTSQCTQYSTVKTLLFHCLKQAICPTAVQARYKSKFRLFV